MNRRTLLQSIVYGLGGGILLNNMEITGKAEDRKKLAKIGLQLYTVRRDLEKDFEGTLRQVAALGIKEVEFAGYFGQNPEQIKKLLKSLKLAAPSAHTDTETLRTGLPKAIEAAKTIGHQYLILGYLPEGERKSLDDYKKLIELLNKAGEKCGAAGLQFAYHNHDFEFKKIEGKTPYDLILAETDAEKVKMEMDLYWINKAGFEPLAYFEKYPKRFPLVHVKDLDNTPERSFTEVGRGVIDFKKIFSKSNAAGIKHYFIEQDETRGAPLESVKISLKYLKELRF
ncbi:MAG TPA: sugar phosphate isomerase/epimerase [Pyrinomonadaceae bacterium]|jgi:sugar phosphate isomerase/epimerase|nr:sugar phosphate isomerase/epimerase [Pyrinomonadaceae bacterium]